MEILCGGEFYGNLTADLFQLRRFHFNNLVISMPEKTWPSVVKIQNMLRITTRNHEIRITHSTAKLNTNSFQKQFKKKYFIKGEFNRTINIEYPPNYLTQANDFEKCTQTPNTHTMHTY